MREIALDTETTGLSAKEGDRIFEIGCVEIIDKKITGQSYHVYINPERDLSVASREITGLTHDFLKEFDTFKKIAEGFLNFIAGDRLIIHNAKFDMSFLEAELERVGRDHLANEVIDTLAMAKSKYPGSPSTLDALCRKFKIDRSKRTKHGALIDAELLAGVYICMSVALTQKDIFSTMVSDDGSDYVVDYGNKKQTPPRNFKVSEEDLENHKLFLTKIKNSLWK